MADFTTFLIAVFCFVDDWLKGKRLRQRGPRTTLSDSEVLTMEVIGAFLGIDTDQMIFHHFRRYWSDWFPGLRHIHRTTFVRQAANLAGVKVAIWRDLLREIDFDPYISIVDSFPVPVCRFARAYRCRRFAGEAAYGYDEMEKQTFYGFRAHVRICWPGVITGLELAPANIHDLRAAEDLTENLQGWLVGDRNYWSPQVREALASQGLELLTPYKSARRERRPWPRWLTQLRRRIETVFAQLVGRLQAKRMWARDMRHLLSRWGRIILAHTFAVWFCQKLGLPSPLQFAQAIAL